MCLLGNVDTLIMRHMIDWGSERGGNFCFHKRKVAKKLQKIQTYSKERPSFAPKAVRLGRGAQDPCLGSAYPHTLRVRWSSYRSWLCLRSASCRVAQSSSSVLRSALFSNGISSEKRVEQKRRVKSPGVWGSLCKASCGRVAAHLSNDSSHARHGFCNPRRGICWTIDQK